MGMTVATALSTVRNQTYESSANFWADDEIRQYLWEGECEIARENQCVEVVTSITTTTSTQETTFTSTVEFIQRVTYDDERLKKVDFRDLDSLDNEPTGSDATTSDPTHYYLFGNNTMGFWPIPTTSATVKIWGSGMPPQITSSVSQFSIAGQFHHALPDYALYRMYLKDQDDGRAKMHLDLWGEKKLRATQQWQKRKNIDKLNVVRDEYTAGSTLLGPV